MSKCKAVVVPQYSYWGPKEWLSEAFKGSSIEF